MVLIRNFALAVGLVVLPAAAMAQANPPVIQQRNLTEPTVQQNKQTAVSTTRPSLRAKSRHARLSKAAAAKRQHARVRAAQTKRIHRPKADVPTQG